jgi:hypothetical protein
MKKLLAGLAISGFGIALAAGPAFAHDCYNTSRSAQGNAQLAAHSPSFMTFNTAAMGFLTSPPPDGPGLCTAGAQFLISELDANAASIGFDPNVVISTRVVQAGGIDNSPNPQAQSNLSNGKGIDHLDENAALNQFINDNIGAAFALCP